MEPAGGGLAGTIMGFSGDGKCRDGKKVKLRGSLIGALTFRRIVAVSRRAAPELCKKSPPMKSEGVYNPETFTVEDARSRVYGLKGIGAAVLAEIFRDRKVRQAKKGKTVDEIIEERIARPHRRRCRANHRHAGGGGVTRHVRRRRRTPVFALWLALQSRGPVRALEIWQAAGLALVSITSARKVRSSYRRRRLMIPTRMKPTGCGRSSSAASKPKQPSCEQPPHTIAKASKLEPSSTRLAAISVRNPSETKS